MCIFQKGQLLQIPSLDYSNEEELTDDTKLLYEKLDKKMDQCEYHTDSNTCSNSLTSKTLLVILVWTNQKFNIGNNQFSKGRQSNCMFAKFPSLWFKGKEKR